MLAPDGFDPHDGTRRDNRRIDDRGCGVITRICDCDGPLNRSNFDVAKRIDPSCCHVAVNADKS